MKKTAVWIICMVIGMLLLPGQIGLAEEAFDYRSDTHSFCRKVAELNAETAGELQIVIKGDKKPELVLFKSEKVPLNFENAGFSVYQLVYGPKGFSVLMTDEPALAVEYLLRQEGVTSAEIDTEITACTAAEEEEGIAFQSWAAESMGFGEYNRFAAAYGSGSATVAVIDSGVFRHSLIQPKISGYGYDYIDNDADPTNDLNGHGTRVAGIVADCTRELPVYIYPIRVLDADASGKISNVVSAILEAADAHADVINLSLSTFSQSELLEEAIRSAVQGGTAVVVAAGNYSCDAAEVTPANMTDAGVIVVGSAEKDGSRSSFSNYGASVDVYAYGRSIMSCSRSGSYVADSGTSMAAPHVSALCAMMDLVHSLSPSGMESRIRRAAVAGNIRIPSASAMIPRSLGFSLNSLYLPVDGRVVLPGFAMPETAEEPIHYESEDSDILRVEQGVWTAVAAGETQVAVRCKGFEDQVVFVTVSEANAGHVLLPSSLTMLESEAFYGIRTHQVTLPPGVLSLEDRVFDGGTIHFLDVPDTVTVVGENDFSGAVVLCNADSFIHTYATEHNLPYILKTND